MAESSPTTTKRPEFVTSRTFDAPVRLVWEAWTKAEHVSRWFTPQPLTTGDCEVDFRPGGVFRVVMRMPDGTPHEMQAKFGRIVEHELIEFAGKIPDGNVIETTVEFSESGGKTTLAVHQVYAFESPATRGAPLGWKATLDQLGQHVARTL
jgi:uncharacterized protein YndB with AHSA1/START domain